jgi:ribose/xylose/arabinose/galactoside ABC-type transport system permease subunit
MAEAADVSTTGAPQSFGRELRAKLLGDYGILLVVLVMGIGLTILQPEYFLSAQNLSNIARQIAMNALLALGLYIVILTAGIDLSVGSVMALSIMLLAMADKAGVPWFLVLFIGPIVGTLIGIINGLGLTLLRLPHPFIMTLGTLNAVRGLCNLVTEGRPVSGISDEVRFIGIADIPLPFGGEFAVIPVSAVLLLVSYCGVAWFLRKVSLGRHIFAIGGNPQAARVAGINVNGVLVFVYAASGFFAGLAALVMAGRTGSGYPNLGIGAELDAIAAVIIGGASFFGGRGSAIGVFAGVLVMGLLRNGLNLMNISAFWQQTLIGVIIVLAVWIDVLRRRSGVKT